MAHQSTFERDFRGRVFGLGPAVYQWLVMRQGMDTVKPDVHTHRFTESAVGRVLSGNDVVAVVTAAATRRGVRPLGLDRRIWEAAQGGAFPYPV